MQASKRDAILTVFFDSFHEILSATLRPWETRLPALTAKAGLRPALRPRLAPAMRILLASFCGLAVAAAAHAATCTVTSTADTNTSGTLRYCLSNQSYGEAIDITATGTITLTSPLPVIISSLTITGPGSGHLTVSGGGQYQVFLIYPGPSVTISGLTIANGNYSYGGGIGNQGKLTVTNTTISGNSAYEGAGIYNNNGGTLAVTNSTISGNSATYGGGIYLDNGTVTVTNSTISGNSAADGGGIFKGGGTLKLANSIVAGNTATASYADIDSSFTDGGGNLASTNSSATSTIDPQLAALGNYGGPTQTMALLPGSAAICAGTLANATAAGVTTDQRGLALDRSCASGSVDAGAVQTNQYVVTTLTDQTDSGATCNGGSTCSLRDAIGVANTATNGDITFLPSLTSGSPGAVNLSTALPALPSITGQINILGPGLSRLSVNGNGDYAGSVLAIATNSVVAIYGLTIAHGSTFGSGGGIYNNGALTLTSSNVVYNNSNGYGGGVYNNLGTVTVTDCSISHNTASSDSGGGIFNRGTVTVKDSTIANNYSYINSGSNGGGGGIYNSGAGTVTVTNTTLSGNSTSGDGGGGILNDGALTVTNSTLYGNSAPNGYGGGISNCGDGTSACSSTATVTNSTISGSSAYNGGGYSNCGAGLSAACTGALTLANSVVAGNSATFSYADIYNYAGSYTNHGGNLAGTNASNASTIASNLAPLGLYGGPTETMVPLPGSPAICAGTKANVTAAGLTTDQRGYPRTNTTYTGYSSASPCVDSGAVQSNYTAVEWVQQPGGTTEAGVAISPAPTVEVLETNPNASAPNNTDAVNGVPVTVRLAQGNGTLSGTLTQAVSGGVATFANLTINAAGSPDQLSTQAITVVGSDQLAAVLSNTFTVIDTTTHFILSAPPSQNAGFTFSLTVTAEDALGHTMTGYAGLVHFTSTDPTALLPVDSVLYSGTRTFNLVQLTRAGAQTITATDTGNSAITGTATITVIAGPPSYFAASGGTPQSAYVNTLFATALTATVTDGWGNPLSGQTINFAVPMTGASATLSAASCVTASNGSCSVTATANGTAGSYVVAASFALMPTVSFSLTNNPTPNLVVTSTADDAGTAANCTPQASTTTGTDGSCSLRDALLEAASLGAANIYFDTTKFASATTFTLSNGTAAIPSYTAIQGQTTGSGAALSNLVTVAGGGWASNFSVFKVNSGVTGAAIANLIITGGDIDGSGAGIYNSGTLTVTNSTFSGNSAYHNGGGIYNNGTLTVTNSTFSGNSGEGDGGGIYNNGTLTVTNSTFSGNGSAFGYGGGLYNLATLNLANSIVAGNTASGSVDIYGSYTNKGGNLVGLPSGVTNISQILAPLANYGGPTGTMVPLPGSQAICGGTVANATGLATDQRGYPRTNTTYTGYSPGSPCVDSGAVQTHYTGVLWVQQPSTTQAGFAISPAPTVEVLETNSNGSAPNNTDAVNGVPVTVRLAYGSGTLGGTLTQTTGGGVATFGNLTISATDDDDQLSTQAITVVGPDALAAVNSSTFKVVGATTRFVVSATSPVTAGSASSVTVTAEDAAGNQNPDYAGTVHFTSTDTQAGLPADSTLTGGVGIFSATLKTAGNQTVTATDTVNSSITRTSNTIRVSAGAPTHLAASGGTPQSASVNTAFATPLTAAVTDDYGNGVSGLKVVFAAPNSGASATLSAPSCTTGSTGSCSVTATANGTAGGPYTVMASEHSLTVNFSLTNTAGAASSMTANAGTTPQSATISTAFANALAVTVKDAGNNPVSGVSVTFTAPATGVSGLFGNSAPAITVATNASGVASAPFTANSTAGGPYIVTASASGLTTVNFSLTNTDTAAIVTSVSSALSNGTYAAGQAIFITVSFSKTVNATGTPQIALNSGGVASYGSGSGTSVLTFSYTVAAGQTTSGGHLDASSAGALTLNGGSIASPSSKPANLTLPVGASAGSLASNKAIVIDAVAPVVSSFSVLFGSQRYLVTGTARTRLPWQISGIQVVFSKPITAGSVASLSGAAVTGMSGLGTNTLTWGISPVPLGTLTLVLAGSGANALTDAAGNGLAGGAGATQNLKILWGDVNDDGVVNSVDLVRVNAAQSGAYNIFADLNGDGVVNAADVQIARTRAGTSLP